MWKTFRDLLQIPVTDAQIDADSYQVPYYYRLLDVTAGTTGNAGGDS